LDWMRNREDSESLALWFRATLPVRWGRKTRTRILCIDVITSGIAADGIPCSQQ